MKKVRIGFIGAGFISHYHARGLKTIEGVELACVCALPLDNATAFADTYGIKDVTDDAMKIAKRKDIDAVVIATPNKFHAPFTLECLKNGKDVFVEKPLAMNSTEADEVSRVSLKTKKLVMVGHMWRFDLGVNYIKDIVQSGKIGKVFKTKGYGIHVNWGPAGWFTDKKLAGGGALADMGVHAIDTVRYILGDPKPVQVYAKIGTYLGDYDVDDTGILMITWDNGVTSIIESGWWQPHMDGPEAGTRLYGSEGYASLYPTELKLRNGFLFGEFKPELPPRLDHCDQSMYTAQMTQFIDCIRNRKTPFPGLKEGITIMNIVDAGYKSSETGKAINL
jgi:predicted dehydrogenase